MFTLIFTGFSIQTGWTPEDFRHATGTDPCKALVGPWPRKRPCSRIFNIQNKWLYLEFEEKLEILKIGFPDIFLADGSVNSLSVSWGIQSGANLSTECGWLQCPGPVWIPLGCTCVSELMNLKHGTLVAYQISCSRDHLVANSILCVRGGLVEK